jgi:hypothetical protein
MSRLIHCSSRNIVEVKDKLGIVTGVGETRTTKLVLVFC